MSEMNNFSSMYYFTMDYCSNFKIYYLIYKNHFIIFCLKQLIFVWCTMLSINHSESTLIKLTHTLYTFTSGNQSDHEHTNIDICRIWSKAFVNMEERLNSHLRLPWQRRILEDQSVSTRKTWTCKHFYEEIFLYPLHTIYCQLIHALNTLLICPIFHQEKPTYLMSPNSMCLHWILS